LFVATLSAAFFVYRAAGAVAPPLALLRVLLAAIFIVDLLYVRLDPRGPRRGPRRSLAMARR